MSAKSATLTPATETKVEKKTKEDSKEVQVAKISSLTTIQVTKITVVCTIIGSLLSLVGVIIVSPNKFNGSVPTLATNKVLIDNKAERAKEFIEKNNQDAQNAQKALITNEKTPAQKEITIEVLNAYITQNQELKNEFIKEKSRFDQAALTNNTEAADSARQRMNQIAIKDAANLQETINRISLARRQIPNPASPKETEKRLEELPVVILLNRKPVTELAELLPIQLKTDPEQFAKLRVYPNYPSEPNSSTPYSPSVTKFPSIWPVAGVMSGSYGVRRNPFISSSPQKNNRAGRPALVNDIVIISEVPVAGAMRGGYGVRRNPFGGRSSEFHKGQDISAPMGTPVIATADGVVTIAGWLRGYGKVVYIDHGNGLSTRYGHLSRIDVTVGQIIHRGTQLGLVGSTGRVPDPHLHYEVRVDGMPVGPIKYLPDSADPIASTARP